MRCVGALQHNEVCVMRFIGVSRSFGKVYHVSLYSIFLCSSDLRRAREREGEKKKLEWEKERNK